MCILKRTKRGLSIVLATFVLIAFSNFQIVQATMQLETRKVTIVIKAGSQNLVLNGLKKKIESKSNITPRIVGSEILSPFKVIIESIGGSMKYSSVEKRIDITLGKSNLKLWIGKNIATVNDKSKKGIVAPQIVNGVVMVPVKFVISNLNGTAVLNTKTKEMTISYTIHLSTHKALEDILVVNVDEYTSSEYVIKQDKNNSYIFLPDQRFRYSLKYPYLDGNSFPHYSEIDGDITFTWEINNEIALEIKIKVGSSEAEINGKSIDIGMAPYRDDDKIMIPINVFITVFDMQCDIDNVTGATIIHYRQNFPKELLYGTWSSTDVNLIMEFKDLSTGTISLPSFADSYIFNKDGTYHYAIISCGGYEDTYISQNGKYKIYGNSIMLYDIVETLYKGNPFVLKYKDKHLEKPDFIFIDNYDNSESKMQIDALWLNKIK